MRDHASLLAASLLRSSADARGMTRQGASDIMVRAALSQTDRHRILTLPYPVEYQVFWQVLAEMGVTKERLMDRLGASP